MRQIWYDYVKTNIDLYFISGLPGLAPPWFLTLNSRYKALWYGYQYITDFLLYFITVSNLIGTILLNDVFDVLASLPPLIHGIQMSSRLIIFQSYEVATKAYIEELNDLLLKDENNPIERGKTFYDIHKFDFRLNRSLTIFEFFSLMMSNIMFFIPECVKSFIYPEEAHTIIVSWYPYDSNIVSYKQMTNVAHTFSWLVINFKMASFDTLFQSLMILHSSLFRQLGCFLGKIIPPEKTDLSSYNREENEKMFRKLRWWIDQHQRTLLATKKLEDLCKPLLFFSYLECLSNMCLCAFLTTVESSWTPLQRFSAVFVVGTVFIQMFVMCRLGDYLEESSKRVSDMGYNPTIFCFAHKIQKTVAIIFNRMHLPVRFSAMNLFYLNSKYYGMLVQGVFSYYMALRQFQSRN